MKTFATLLLITAGSLAVAPGISAKEVDEESGFIIDTNWELVKSQCTVCHSAKLVTGQRGSRQTWEDIIRWMQATQRLWTFEPQAEAMILDYLAANYPPDSASRRAPLSPALMPDNPYKAVADPAKP
jgi:hypothetical protein